MASHRTPSFPVDLAPVEHRQATSVGVPPCQITFPVYSDAAILYAIAQFTITPSNLPLPICAILEELGRWNYYWLPKAGEPGKFELIKDTFACNKPAGDYYTTVLRTPYFSNPYRHLERAPEPLWWRDPTEPTPEQMKRLAERTMRVA